jgi:hypothetical protein
MEPWCAHSQNLGSSEQRCAHFKSGSLEQRHTPFQNPASGSYGAHIFKTLAPNSNGEHISKAFISKGFIEKGAHIFISR